MRVNILGYTSGRAWPEAVSKENSVTLKQKRKQHLHYAQWYKIQGYILCHFMHVCDIQYLAISEINTL